ncbi:hypothetical protein JF770_06380 [Mycobacterium intracellulare]|uniref:LPO_1073/Vpar_1526 family protein n=1 Tax=Mycobacterium intracellulare TaxID=1767 RepID=UPI001CD9F45B|nr:LPO_1073/Vpar_1526 family protein [Mycobacterium intracellulare]MCA2303181.1 hypothetical protein [Mycobacterium intracellulare]MCA2346456.1 hypothetical protein [Mycobacterium intracellulare]
MNDSQKARDYADQKQLTADTINYSEHKHYNIDGEAADIYLLQLFENNFPKLHNEAMQVAAACAKEMAIAVIVNVCEADPDLLQNLRRPNVQAALLSAQQSYAETGDPDSGAGDASLGLLLSRLVAKVVKNPNRSLTDIVTRRAIAIAPLLTRQQINSLTAAAIFQTCTFTCSDASELLEVMDDFYKHYYGDLAVGRNEYSYMESVGVGSMSLMTGWGDDPFESLCKKYRQQLRKTFRESGLPAEIEASHRSEYLEPVPRDETLVRLRSDRIDDLLGDGRLDIERSRTDSKSIRALRTFVSQQFISADELKQKAEAEKPELFSNFMAFHKAGGFGFQLNTIGYVLAKQELDIRFPGNVLFENLLDTEPVETELTEG